MQLGLPTDYLDKISPRYLDARGFDMDLTLGQMNLAMIHLIVWKP